MINYSVLNPRLQQSMTESQTEEDGEVGDDVGGGGGRDVVSQPGMAKVDTIGPAPDTDPGHIGSCHAHRKVELHILTCEGCQWSTGTSRILDQSTVLVSSLRTSFGSNVEECIRGCSCVAGIIGCIGLVKLLIFETQV